MAVFWAARKRATRSHRYATEPLRCLRPAGFDRAHGAIRAAFVPAVKAAPFVFAVMLGLLCIGG